jgi:hypothetical protein
MWQKERVAALASGCNRRDTVSTSALSLLTYDDADERKFAFGININGTKMFQGYIDCTLEKASPFDHIQAQVDCAPLQ